MSVKIVCGPTGSGKTSWPAATPYLNGSQNPRDFNLPHNEWRKHQRETLMWLTDGVSGRVVSLVRTKSLQQHNYDHLYGFTAHYGKANFLCTHPDALPHSRCDECLYDEMKSCDIAGDCSYMISKSAAWNSNRASLNYAYWMTAARWREVNAPSYLYCDECHNLSELVVNFCGCTITTQEQQDWNLPDFPTIVGSGGSLLLGTNPTHDATGWLVEASRVMARHYDTLRNNPLKRELFKKCDQLARKLGNTLNSLRDCPQDWYIRSGGDAREYRGKLEPAFICKPKTARYHAPTYFVNGKTTVMMSATIGDVKAFATELGIDSYQFRAVPNQWPPSSRPIHILDAPKMGWSKNETEHERKLKFDKQADEISKFIQLWPPDWPGLIHVTRKMEEVLLSKRLAKRGLGDRVWYIPGKAENYIPTDDQLVKWQKRKLKVPNSILVTCSFMEGYDGLEEKINISAKVPFPRVGSPGSYEYEWMRYDRKRYDAVAGVTIAQQQGRNRRGRLCDYDTPVQVNGANAIADASWERVYDKMPKDVQEAICQPK